MKLSGNTIFITGGGSGIGRGLDDTLGMFGNALSPSEAAILLPAILGNPPLAARCSQYTCVVALKGEFGTGTV
jgi:uncharacterized oxidoreductase